MEAGSLADVQIGHSVAQVRFKDHKTEAVSSVIRRHLPTGFKRLLVVGCGTGLEAAVLAQQFGAAVTGVDLFDTFDPRAAETVDLRIGDAMSLDFDDETFDFVYSYHALEHFTDPDRALAEMRRVLCPDGHYCIGTPSRSRVIAYLGSKSATTADKIRWNASDWKARLQGRFRNEYGAHAGFERSELREMLQRTFQRAEDVTLEYYLAQYPRHRHAISLLESTFLSHLVFPSIYFFGSREAGARQRGSLSSGGSAPLDS
jgi:ubiquinone/menaquinone biosynthesis C-methylase UbiE